MVQQHLDQPATCGIVPARVVDGTNQQPTFPGAHLENQTVGFDCFQVVRVPEHQHRVNALQVIDFGNYLAGEVEVLQLQQQVTGDLLRQGVVRDVWRAPKEPM